MTGTIRKLFSRPCNKRVNHEKEWKRSRIVDSTCDTWSVRPGAFRREFDYTHSTHANLPVARHRQYRRSVSATKRKERKRAHQDKLNRLEDNDQEYAQMIVADFEPRDSAMSEKEDTDISEVLDDDCSMVMKFGSSLVRLSNTYTYSNQYANTGQCLTRCIRGKWLVLPCDLVMDDLSYLYSDYAWEEGSIGTLMGVSIPDNPYSQDAQGWYVEA